MVITPSPPSAPFGAAATTMSVTFDALAFPPLASPPAPWPWMRSVAPTLTQPLGPNYYQLDYLLPLSSRVGDVVECLLIDVLFPFPILIHTFTLDDYSLFLALRRQAGVMRWIEMSVRNLVTKGVTPGTYDLQFVHYRIPTPTPPWPFPPGPQTPLQTVAVSFVNTYVIT